MVKVRITDANISNTIKRISDNHIEVYDLMYDGMLCAEFSVKYLHYIQLKRVLNRQGTVITVLQITGPMPIIKGVCRRYILVVFALLILFFTVWVPGRVLFIAVEGNHSIPTTTILEMAERCGICFGAKRSLVRSESVKNNLLESIPSLNWAGITTSGCTAKITVREDDHSVQKEKDLLPSSMVAHNDGIILSVVATAGQPVCSVGQAVKKGQVLISGRINEGILLKLTKAQGEVFALTERSVQLVFPIKESIKERSVDSLTNFSLIIGKNRINLSKDSGIYHTGCGKIYEQYHFVMPGGFVLPVSLCAETVTHYTLSESDIQQEVVRSYLETYAADYINSKMVSGRIVSSSVAFRFDDEWAYLDAKYFCTEMIARERAEEIDIYHGENH